MLQLLSAALLWWLSCLSFNRWHAEFDSSKLKIVKLKITL